MKKTVKSFYIFLQLRLGYTVFASQFSETNFTNFPFAYDSYLASFDNSSLDSYKITCLLQTWAFSSQKDFYDWGQFSTLQSYNSAYFKQIETN